MALHSLGAAAGWGVRGQHLGSVANPAGVLACFPVAWSVVSAEAWVHRCVWCMGLY
jgi:hypothetical protein